MNPPETVSVVPSGHNRITILVQSPDGLVCGSRYAYKSTRGYEKHGPGFSPVYWYWAYEGQDIVDFLYRFNYADDDELIISDKDFLLVESLITGPLIDLNKRDVRVVRSMKSVRNKNAVLIEEPCDDCAKWAIFTRQGNSVSFGFYESPDGVVRSLRKGPESLPVFLTESALEHIQLVAEQPAFPVRVVNVPEMPERVYNVRPPTFFQTLTAFVRWQTA